MSSLFRSHIDLLTNKRENTVKESLINRLKENAEEVQYEANEWNQDVLEVCEASSSLCITLEAIFLHGLKDSFLWQTLNVLSSDIERRPEPSFWPLLMVFLHKQVLQQIQELTQIKTEIGQCRSWIRLSLNECILSSYLKNIRSNSSALRPYYKNDALLKDVERLDIAVGILEGMENSLGFNLPLNTSLLNQWPDLSLQLSGVWSPALKLGQIASGIDVAVGIKSTPAIPTPKPLQSNEFFSESISNSPFTRQIEFRNSNENLAEIAQNADNMNEMLDNNTDTEDKESEQEKLPTGDINLTLDDLLDLNMPGNSLTSRLTTSWSFDAPSPTRTTTSSLSTEDLTLKTNSQTPSSRNSLRALYMNQLSYNALLRNHENTRQPDWTEVWEKFLLQNPTPNVTHETIESDNSLSTMNDFEFISDNLGKLDMTLLQSMLEQLSHLAHEPGLNVQGFICKDCQHPLGIGQLNYQ